MNLPYGVAVSPDGKYAYVSGYDPDSIAVVDVSDATNPTVVGSITGDTTNMNGAWGVAVLPDGEYMWREVLQTVLLWWM